MMLSCREMTELATAYTDGSLGLGDRWRFRLHLSMCRHCRRYVHQLRLTVAAVGRSASPPVEPSAETQDALLQAFRSRPKP